jgi:polyphenol oxidase
MDRTRPDVDFLTAPALVRVPGLVHGFGTRSLDLRALRRLAAGDGMAIVLLDQVHSGDVFVVDRAPAPGARRRKADGLATGRPGLLLAVKTADCLPVLIVDPEKRAVAAVHSGWRGTRAGILGRAASVLIERFGSRPGSLLAALGPCIGARCYEVGGDVRDEFDAAGLPIADFRPSPARPGAFLLDLAAANRGQLIDRGVSPRRISVDGACPHCDPRLLSFRRDRDASARLYNFVGFRAPGV